MKWLTLSIIPAVLIAGPGVGEPAPDFIEPDTAGQMHSLSDFKYNTIMLHFWHSC